MRCVRIYGGFNHKTLMDIPAMNERIMEIFCCFSMAARSIYIYIVCMALFFKIRLFFVMAYIFKILYHISSNFFYNYYILNFM